MAIDRSIVVAVARRDDRLFRPASADGRFPPHLFVGRADPHRERGRLVERHRAAVQAFCPPPRPVRRRRLPGRRRWYSARSGPVLVVGSGRRQRSRSSRRTAASSPASRSPSRSPSPSASSGRRRRHDQAAPPARRACLADRLRPAPRARGRDSAGLSSSSVTASSWRKIRAARAAYNRRVTECHLARRVLERPRHQPAAPAEHFGS